MADAAHEALSQVARTVFPEGSLIHVEQLTGGVSANLQALDIATPVGRERVVVRQLRGDDWKPREQGVASREFALLAALAKRGFAVPRPLQVDESGELLPGPYLVIEFVPGTTTVTREQLPSALDQMAEFLARLHTLSVEAATVDTEPPDLQLPDLPQLDDPLAGCLEYLPDDPLGARLRGHLSALPPFSPRNEPSLVHGDFWPGNILWQGGRLAAVIDWEDAALGDPLADVACSRVELLCQHDASAMELFTEHYRSRSSLDWTDQPLWEVFVSAGALATMAQWGLPPQDEARRRAATRDFLESAAKTLLEKR